MDPRFKIIDEDQVGLIGVVATPKKRRYPKVANIVFTCGDPTEDDIKLIAYFIWEKSGKVKSADECWFEAKDKMGLE